jgi:flagellar hook-length control protein FliK
LSLYEILIASLQKPVGNTASSGTKQLPRANSLNGAEPGKEFAAFLAGVKGNTGSASLSPEGSKLSAYAVFPQEKISQKSSALKSSQDTTLQFDTTLKSNLYEHTGASRKGISTDLSEAGATNRLHSFQVGTPQLQWDNLIQSAASDREARSMLKAKSRQGAEKGDSSALSGGFSSGRSTGSSTTGDQTGFSVLEKVLGAASHSSVQKTVASEKASTGSMHSVSTLNHAPASALLADTATNYPTSGLSATKQPDPFFIFEKSPGLTLLHGAKATDSHDKGKTAQLEAPSSLRSSSEQVVRNGHASAIKGVGSAPQESTKKASSHSPGDHQTALVGDDKPGNMVLQIKEKEKDIKKDGASSNPVSREHREIKPQPQVRGENSTASAEEYDSRVRPNDSARNASAESSKPDSAKAQSPVSSSLSHHVQSEGIPGQLQGSAPQQKTLSATETCFRQELLNHIEAQFSNLRNSGCQRATIILDPPYLGNLEVEIKVHGTQIKATFVASTEMVKNLLESNMADLKQSFADAGFDQGETSVFLRENRSNGSGEREGGRGWTGGPGSMPYEEKIEKSVASVTAVEHGDHHLINLRI